ncbi:hypothetical protein BBK82_36295 [Lentzea guizhouensis]|uniref:DUF4240 domain-containing protein n=1 Tax=Lentzea guizhouensis TaxID=1586287 RepID=A0A1B2I012_9PSEU|nr:DUF4240 domain-containing protein [Lentzea guizhouensis]ANZ43306.1 hypothetical protein BBK82_36295 [Lentzea guizhouensis]
MDLNAFWALLDRSASQTADQDARLEWLTASLASLPPAEIAGFALRVDELRRRVDTWGHWHAADLICAGLCSDDGFFYFQAWLIGLGRETFEAVAADPDALAEVPHVRHLAASGGVHAWPDDEWPDWEGLDHVASEALSGEPGSAELQELLGDHELLVSPEPSGEHWDFADPREIGRRVPRLGVLFGKVA